jgi:hypothetical protein
MPEPQAPAIIYTQIHQTSFAIATYAANCADPLFRQKNALRRAGPLGASPPVRKAVRTSVDVTDARTARTSNAIGQ